MSTPLQDKNQQQEASGFTGSSIAPCLSEAQLQLGPPQALRPPWAGQFAWAGGRS